MPRPATADRVYYVVSIAEPLEVRVEWDVPLRVNADELAAMVEAGATAMVQHLRDTYPGAHIEAHRTYRLGDPGDPWPPAEEA